MAVVGNVRDRSESLRFVPDDVAIRSPEKIDEEIVSLSSAHAVDSVTDDSYASS